MALVNFTEDEHLEVLNHSCAHLLAQAVRHLFPDAKFWVGPVVAEGFYYDMDLGDHTLTDEDLEKISKEMKKCAKADKRIVRQEISREEALERFKDDPYKVDLINRMEDGTNISMYTQGDFTDLCRGPHVESTKKCRYFKLLKHSGAYWKGDANNKMLQRVYGVCFDSKEDLDAYLETLEEAGKLDNTAIVFFADHHPLNMDLNYLYDCTPAIDDDGTTIDRSEGMNEFRSPLVIYCPSILGDETFTDVTSTYDILPTVLNLYNLNYDPHFYLGTDYFSQQESIVYFPDGDWTTNKGTYYAATNEFVPADESVSVDDSYITNNTARVNNAFNISLMIYQTDYFKYRSEITTPDSSLKNFMIVQDPETGESIQVEATATPETSE